MAFLATDDLDFETYYVQIECSNHMSGHKSSFMNLNKNYKSVINFENESSVNVMGIYDV